MQRESLSSAQPVPGRADEKQPQTTDWQPDGDCRNKQALRKPATKGMLALNASWLAVSLLAWLLEAASGQDFASVSFYFNLMEVATHRTRTPRALGAQAAALDDEYLWPGAPRAGVGCYPECVDNGTSRACFLDGRNTSLSLLSSPVLAARGPDTCSTSLLLV